MKELIYNVHVQWSHVSYQYMYSVHLYMYMYVNI